MHTYALEWAVINYAMFRLAPDTWWIPFNEKLKHYHATMSLHP